MAKITLTNDQLRLIQNALEFYSRIGILQLDRILDHPSFKKMLYDKYTPKKKLEVGDDTVRGEIVEIGEGYIKTKGTWGNGEEIKTWTDIEKITLSPDYNSIHTIEENIENYFYLIKSLITGMKMGRGSYGIHSTEIDDSCRLAFDLTQVIRHEFWKNDPNRRNYTVDSNVSLITDQEPVKVQLDTVKEKRKQKISKIKKSSDNQE